MEGQPPGFRPWTTLAALSGLCFAMGFISASLAPFVPSVIVDLRLTPVTAGIALGAWQGTMAISSVPLGLLLDRIGVRVGVTVGGLLAVASCVLRAEAYDAPTLIAAVALAGLAWPLVVGATAKIIGTVYEGSGRRLGAGISLAAVNAGFGAMLALGHPVLGAWLGGWRPALALAGVPMAVAVVAWILFSGPLRMRGGPRASAVELVRDVPLLLRNFGVLAVLVVALPGLASGHALGNWLPTVLGGDGYDPSTAGYAAAGYTAVGIISSLVIPVVASPESRRWWLVGVLASIALSLVLLQMMVPALLVLALALVGFGIGAIPPLALLTLADTPGVGQRMGGISGLYYATTGMAGLIGPVIVGEFVVLTGGFHDGFYALAVLVSGAALLASRLPSPAGAEQSLPAWHRSQR